MDEDEDKDDYEYKINDDQMEEDELRLEAIRSDFYSLIYSDDHISYKLDEIGTGEADVIDSYLKEEMELLRKDPFLNALMRSVSRRYYADFSMYFPQPKYVFKAFKTDPAWGVILIDRSIHLASTQLARQLGWVVRSYGSEMFDFLIEKGMMNKKDPMSLMILSEYAEAARTKLFMETPSEEMEKEWELIYERLMYNSFKMFYEDGGFHPDTED